MLRALSRNLSKDLKLYFGKDSEITVDEDLLINVIKGGLCVSFFVDDERSILIKEINKCSLTGTVLNY